MVNKKSELIHLIQKWLFHNNISIKKKDFNLEYTTHPEFPQLISLVETLEKLNIPFEVYQLENLNEIEMLPDACISITKANNAPSEIIEIRNKKSGFIVNSIYGRDKFNNVEFLNIFSGIILELKNQDNRLTYTLKRIGHFKKEVLYLLTFLIILVKLNFVKLIWELQLFNLLGIIGVTVSLLILKLNISGKSSTFINKICSNGSRFDCNGVFNSKFSRGLFGFKLFDLAGIYFLFQLAIILFSYQFLNTTLILLIALQTLATAVAIYSILYQYFIIKLWCPLCLSIILIIFSEYFLLLLQIDSLSLGTVSLQLMYTILSALIISLVIWKLISTCIANRDKLQSASYRLNKLRRNKKVLNSILHDQRSVSKVSIPGEIAFGCESCTTTITFVFSPTCIYCKANFKSLIELKNNPEKKFKIIIRFKFNQGHNNKQERLTMKILYDIFQGYKESFFIKKTFEMLGSKDLNQWNDNNLSYSKNNERFTTYQQEINNWIQANAITYTPFLAINSKEFPHEFYSLQEIHNFIPE